ncbi:MAG: hypothetical protein ABIH23_05795, partial [bacterium]
GGAFFVAKTVYMGIVDFSGAPWGKYTLIVTPPAELLLERKTLKTQVEDISYDLLVKYEIGKDQKAYPDRFVAIAPICAGWTASIALHTSLFLGCKSLS